MVMGPTLFGTDEPTEAAQEVHAGTTPNATLEVQPPAMTPTETATLGEVESESEERTLEFVVGQIGEPGSFKAEFINRGGRLANLWLTNFVDQAGRTDEERQRAEYWVPLLQEAVVDGGRIASLEWRASESSKSLLSEGVGLQSALWVMKPVMRGSETIGVDFSYAPGTGVRFVKRVRFTSGSYEVHVELEIENVSAGDAVAGVRQFTFTPAVIVPRIAPDDNFAVEPKALVAFDDSGAIDTADYELAKGGVPSELGGTLAPGKVLKFVAVQNKHFAAVLRTPGTDPGALVGSAYRVLRDLKFLEQNPALVDEAYRFLVTDVSLSLNVPSQGKATKVDYELYLGPKSTEAMSTASEQYTYITEDDLGFFSPISGLLLAVLGFFHMITGNWGFSIILLTISVRLVLFPLNRRSQTAMSRYQAKMKRIQPKIDALKKKYENDQQAQRQEQAKLMQSEGAFPPLGGCAPMFLQIPVFWGLFSALRVSFDLRQAPFISWIHDLAKPDALMELGWTIPVVGWQMETLNVLPPLMVVLWVLQQRSMPQPADAQAARMQKMMMWMPVLFGVMLYNYAAGLSLYMITQSGLGIFEQRVIKKYWPVDDTEQPKKKSGFMARLAKAQEEQMKRMKTQQDEKARNNKKRDKARK